MAIIGISGSPVKNSNTDRITKALLKKSGKKTKFIKLSKLSFYPCRGCAHLCATTNMCGRKDELQPYIKDVRDAEALILSSPVHRGNMSAWMFSFISRLWCLGHTKRGELFKNKPVVLVTVGIGAENIKDGIEIYKDTFIFEHNPKIIGEIYYNTATPPCLTCGASSYCKKGGLWFLLGNDEEKLKNFKFTPDKFKRWEDNPVIVDKVDKIGKLLSEI